MLSQYVLLEYTLEDWSVTKLLVVAILLIYNVEILLRISIAALAVRVAMAYSFLNYLEPGRPLAPVLH